MTFGSEGPMVQGTWVNPTTGDSFTVRDSFFEDNQYVVTTTDGRYIRYDQLQHYIQADPKSINGIKEAAANRVNNEPLPAEVSSLIATDDNVAETMITPEDYELIYGNKSKSLGNLNDNTRHIAPAHAHATAPAVTALPENMNTAIIKKALNNSEQPKFNVVLSWDNYPAKQIEMLYDIMGISEEEILEWYLDNIQMDDVITAIKDSIKKKICSDSAINNVCDTSETVVEHNTEVESVKTPKKVTKSVKSKK
jgi:hypothetical protein